MNTVNPAESPLRAESSASAISWSAVIGGAFIMASFSLIFMVLGFGLGLSLIVPWAGATLGVAAIVWLIATHAVSAGLGGYLAGRFRTRWSSIPRDEIYFRDTAHGLLSWSVSFVVTTAFLVSVTSAMVAGGADAIAENATGMLEQNQRTGEISGYAGDRDSDVEDVARRNAEEVRKATVTASLWMFAALLIGAFCASIAATFGGKQRDEIDAGDLY
jgi:hypothetical protein